MRFPFSDCINRAESVPGNSCEKASELIAVDKGFSVGSLSECLECTDFSACSNPPYGSSLRRASSVPSDEHVTWEEATWSDQTEIDAGSSDAADAEKTLINKEKEIYVVLNRRMYFMITRQEPVSEDFSLFCPDHVFDYVAFCDVSEYQSIGKKEFRISTKPLNMIKSYFLRWRCH